MSQQFDPAAALAAINNKFRGAILLGGAQPSAGGKVRVRNAEGKPLMCCWTDCQSDGDNRYAVTIAHPQPQFPGDKRTLTYIFCGPEHRRHWLKGTPYENRA